MVDSEKQQESETEKSLNQESLIDSNSNELKTPKSILITIGIIANSILALYWGLSSAGFLAQIFLGRKDIAGLFFALGMCLVFLYLAILLARKKTSFKVARVLSMIGLCVILIHMSSPVIIPQLLNARRAAWQSRVKKTLRSVGSSQLVYMDGNLKKNYGTWKIMQGADYIQEGYTRTNIIDDYSIAMYKVTTPKFGDNSTFTIIAVPRRQKNRLRTFALGEDQTPRVFVGTEERFTELISDSSISPISLHDKTNWGPLK